MTQIDIEKLRGLFIEAHTLMREHSASCRRDDPTETMCCTMANARARILHATLTTIPALLSELERKTKALEAVLESARVGQPGSTPLKSKWATIPAAVCHQVAAALKGEHHE
jgi:hypothetical protein